jgi:hypothetical protein
VGGITSLTKPTEQEEVDARLIAAAPDLLEALLRVRDTLVSLGEDYPGGVLMPAVGAADTAIRKARGDE